MIKANEFFVGAWIDYDGIKQLDEDDLEVLFGARDYDNCKPISLTEEWLLRFGFEYKRTDKSDTYRHGHFRANFVTDGKFKGKRFLVYGNALTFEDFVNCEFVHQLQNLYFALTGEELTIKG